MKKALAALVILTALFAACGGENQQANNAAGESTAAAATTEPAAMTAEEARAWVEANLSEERMQEIYVESAAINKAAITVPLAGRDITTLTEEEQQELQQAAQQIIDVEQEKLRTQFELTTRKLLAVMDFGAERQWFSTLAQRINARADELAEQYSGEY